MVDLGRLDAMIKRPDCDFCSLVVLGCKQSWQGIGTWEEALESTDTTCVINALDVHRQQAGGYALQITEWHKKKPFQWVEFEIIFNRQEPRPGIVQKSSEVYPMVDFGVLRRLFRNCEENHSGHHDVIPNTRVDDIYVINAEEMKVVVAPAGTSCRYCALSYVVS